MWVTTQDMPKLGELLNVEGNLARDPSKSPRDLLQRSPRDPNTKSPRESQRSPREPSSPREGRKSFPTQTPFRPPIPPMLRSYSSPPPTVISFYTIGCPYGIPRDSESS